MNETVYTAMQVLTLGMIFISLILTISIFFNFLVNIITDWRYKDDDKSNNLFTTMVCTYIPSLHNDKDLRNEVCYFLRSDYCLITMHKKNESAKRSIKQ